MLERESGNNGPETEKKEPRRVRLSRGFRFFVYLVCLTSECVCNVSTGILSAGSKYIKESLKMNDTQYGMFSPFNCTGRVIGSSVYIIINQKLSAKWIFFFHTLMQALCVIGYKFTTNVPILLALRFGMGFSLMPITCYVPVFINQFGIQSLKNVQMSAIPLIQAGGKNLGYLVYALVGERNWQNGFLIEAIYLLTMCFCLFISSEDFFSRTLFSKPRENDEERVSCSVFVEEDIENQGIDKEKEGEKVSLFTDLKLLAKNPVFVIGSFCRCVIFGVNTGYHFWISDFMRNALNVNNPYVLFTSYTVICLTGPLGGVVTNYIFKPCIGNYYSRQSSWPLFFFQCLASFFAIAACLVKSIYFYVPVIISYFISNSCCLSILQGILVSCVEKRIAATGFTIANIFTQILTSGTTPVLYGVVNDRYKNKYPFLAMLCMEAIHVVAIPFLGIMAILRNRKFDMEEKQKKLIEKEEGTELEEKN